MAVNRLVLRNGVVAGLLLVVLIANVFGTYRGLTSRAPGMNDFLSRWEGARSFFIEGLSPYSDAASLNIQDRIYGRPAVLGEDDLGLFAYPFYTVFYVWPLVYLPYAWASAVWMVFLEVCVILGLLLILDMFRWRPGVPVQVMLLVFTLLNYYAFRGLILGQPSHVVFLLTMVALWGLSREHFLLAGAALALATIKPQMGFLLVPFLLLWGLRERRWQFIGAFTGVFLVLMAVSFLLQPDWFTAWVDQVRLYPEYTRDGSPVWIATEFYHLGFPEGTIPTSVLRGVGYVLRGVLVAWMLWAWYTVLIRRRQERLFWTVMITLLVTHTAGPRTATPHYLVFLPVLILVLKQFARRPLLSLGLVMVLFVVPWWHFLATIIPPNLESLSVFLPLPLVLIPVLWWTRQDWPDLLHA